MSPLYRRSVLTIIASYNRAHYLQETVESVLAQDYPHKKIIIIDDGSTDETRFLCAELMKKNPGLISYFYQHNGGCASARNRGLEHIGEDSGYVCFLDSDDRFLPGKFAREVDLLDKDGDAGFTYSDAILFDTVKDREVLQPAAAAGNPGDFAIEHFISNEAKSSALMYRAQLLENRRFREDFLYNEDSDFLQKIAIEHKALYVDQPGTWVRWHEKSKSRNTIEILKAVLRSNLEIIIECPDFYQKYKARIDQQMERNKRNLAIELLLEKRWGEVGAYTDNWFLKIQSALRFPYFIRARRSLSTWFSRSFR